MPVAPDRPLTDSNVSNYQRFARAKRLWNRLGKRFRDAPAGCQHSNHKSLFAGFAPRCNFLHPTFVPVRGIFLYC